MCNISNRLLTERKRLKKNQAEMAAIAGVAKRTYCNYESGNREPTTGFLAAISAAGADVQYILTGIPGYKPGPPSVLEAARQQAYIEAVEKAAESNAKLPSVGNLDKDAYPKSEAKTDCEAVLDKDAYPKCESPDYHLSTAEDSGGYNVSPVDAALLDNLAHCPKNVQDAIRRLALVSADAGDKTKSGTINK